MKKIHSFFLVIFLALVFVFPLKTEAREEKIADDLKVSAAYSDTLQCSKSAAHCSDKPMSSYLPSVQATPKPKNLKKPPSLDAELIFKMINDHRKGLGLPPYEKEDKLCKLAESRGPELYDEIFVSGDIHGGLYKRKIPFWITENMINQPNEEAAMNWWLHSSIHRKAIEGDFKYSCGVCWGNSCAQLFTSYVPKAE